MILRNQQQWLPVNNLIRFKNVNVVTVPESSIVPDVNNPIGNFATVIMKKKKTERQPK